jgi:MFS family permease
MRPIADAEPSRRWSMLLLLSLAELLGMSLWFTASAVAPQLQEAWGLSAQQAGWLTTVVQLGFVGGTAAAAVLNLADVVPERPYFAASAICAALANALLVVAPGFAAVLLLRFLTGFFLAGVYPPAMKMIATWFRSERGLAIGTVVGALTLGKATPYLLRALEGAALAPVVLTASAGAVLGALLVGLLYREGPFPFARRPFSWGLVGLVVRHRPTRLAIGGYLGHMWELYAGWTLVSVYLFDFFRARGASGMAAWSLSGLTGFAVIGMGALGAVLAGVWADRLGRERITIWAMAVSGACSLVIGWLMAAPTWMVITLALLWGFTIVADSAQFSAVVTEVAPAHAVGTALTLQTSAGFLLTAGSIWLAVEISSRFGWGLAFSMLVVGPALGIAAMVRLKSARFASGAETAVNVRDNVRDNEPAPRTM